jgi:pteridine reductase
VADTVLITGGAKRIGAACARLLHQQGFDVIIHYHHSKTEAAALCGELNHGRPNSAFRLKADLSDPKGLTELNEAAIKVTGSIHALVNNASAFYRTPFKDATDEQWDDLFACNLKAPFFLSQRLANPLSATQGCIVNIADIHAERGLPDYPIYSLTKAGLVALTKILAKELGPAIRVNAIAPGAILWPEQDGLVTEKKELLDRVVLKRMGEPADIAKAVLFLITDASYITGQVITVDGGRMLFS